MLFFTSANFYFEIPSVYGYIMEHKTDAIYSDIIPFKTLIIIIIIIIIITMMIMIMIMIMMITMKIIIIIIIIVIIIIIIIVIIIIIIINIYIVQIPCGYVQMGLTNKYDTD